VAKVFVPSGDVALENNDLGSFKPSGKESNHSTIKPIKVESILGFSLQ
jgi:hypothetical protein